MPRQPQAQRLNHRLTWLGAGLQIAPEVILAIAAAKAAALFVVAPPSPAVVMPFTMTSPLIAPPTPAATWSGPRPTSVA